MTQHSNETKKPDFIVYFVPERRKAPWVRFGAGWENKDGEGISIEHDCIPTGQGRIVLRTRESVEKQHEEFMNQPLQE